MATTERPQIDNGKGLLVSSGIVSSMTLVSRVLGLIRDMLIAYLFGAGPAAEAFVVAFRIPNLFRRLFAEGAFSQAFVPVLSEYKTLKSHAEVRGLVDRVAGNLGVILLVVTVLAVAGSPVVAAIFAPGFIFKEQWDEFRLTHEMLRITFPYLMLISLTALSGAILNSYQRFAVPAFTPVFLNLSLILCALYLRPYLQEPIFALAWAVLIAGVLQLSFQLPFLARIQLLPRPKVDRHHDGVKKILALMLPALFAVSVGQISLLLDTMLASFLETGSIPWLYYSDRLLELPLALFGIAIATVILPNLSASHVTKSSDEFARTLDWAIRMVCLVGIPATAALIYLAEPMIITIFYGGDFAERDVWMASISLKAYATGLLGWMLVKVLAPGYFARQDTKTPMKIAVVALVANMVFNLILVYPLAHTGLALATSISAFINAGLLFAGLYRLKVYQRSRGWLLFGLRILLANLVMLGLLAWLNESVEAWLAWDFWIRMGYLLMMCAAGAGTYLLVLLLTGFRIQDIRR
ncbi:MAG: murein biosynthesis integral membrane protein MurJ [Pseudomonadales bacterium]|jgi:putative peptidoglycan lipid II flippase|nr:murein biosynthesis integral membrane protein MurJ [Pseudomonadales bacterium]MDP7146077.1 murein biosynthesis integral membrane protein MurJ [Pseudomonadales bacterium]MDP7360132.1 murein biosynthesis integral membrane protein MurJ [Pseudomonadales bacterium]MDP7594251.1 murein biosynthesis integral membrane protein MurJ [Pseudomonadales bacterium]HJN51819.1 murein biosynthesis integral membrane protein MurJ [Pseudomonadales bacterium]|tara:strand:- start:5843 stop:7411 length:1569 start_codon:yes stop_codon:yes gene_type:complete